MGRAKVLVVDDDLLVLEVAGERLKTAGYDVLLRDRSLGTMEYIAKERPEFILLDVMMPALSGPRLAALIKNSPMAGQTHIILHSSKSDDELASLLKSTEALGAIQKSGNTQKFLGEFEALVQKVRPA